MAAARHPKPGPGGRRVGRLATLVLAVLCGSGLLATTSCDSQDAILLIIRPPSGVQLRQYEVRIQDRVSRTLVYQSGIQPVAAVTSGRDLFVEPLRLGLKLSKAGSFLVFVRASAGTLAPDGSKPAQRTSEYFFADITQTAGTTEIDGNLLEVTPDFDRDFDHFPDSVTWPLANLAAKVQYQSQLDVLDCVDRDPAPSDPQLPAGLYAEQINPLATPRCGLAIDVACAAMAPVCKDADGDGENEATDCDDHDATRFHGNPRPRNCCTCTDHNTCATDHSKRANQAVCQPARCDSSFDFDCTGQVVPCFVDDDCDGYSPNDPVPSQRDCDDTNPDVHPGAAKKCSDPSHDWACDGNPRGGCVTCDLDGDGYQRLDAAAGCPDASDIHPGKLDCDDNDRGVFPGSTSYPGATLTIPDLKQNEGGGSVAAAMRRLCFNKAVDGKTAQDADCDGKLQLGCPPAMAATKVCDADGDGFPNANPGCNPSGVAIDCDDTDYKTFPGAPDKCGDGKAQNCSNDTACTMDADKDGYNSDVDCDDTDPNRHPFATELCNGVDDDCDGLIDEMNPDNVGGRMTETHGAVTTILSCTDNKVGDCGLPAGGPYPGRCVCSGLIPGKHAADPGRNACPGTRDDSTTAPKCFGAVQPGLQTCAASTPHDEDCDGRTDAPDGKSLKEYGDACGVTTGECVAGKVIGCDRTKINKFSKLATPSFTVSPAFNDERRFLVCDATALYPSVELCDGKDNDCDAIPDDCTGAGIKTPKCCAGINMCIDLNSTFANCGSCTGACSLATASACVNAKCMCGTNAACAGATPRCKGSTSCVQCLANTDCSGATPFCNGANVCVQCLASADCAGTPATPACDTTANKCVACVANGDCGTGMQCDVPSHTCVQCVDNTGCSGATPACKTALHQCVGCVLNSDCGPGMQCDTTVNACVQCVDNTGCGAMAVNKVCKAAAHQCVQCLVKTDCAGTTQCDTGTDTCVQCVDDGGCSGATPHCKAGGNTCIGCNDGTQCPNPLYPKCDPMAYVCYQCLADGDCAGRPGTLVCDTNAHLCVQCKADGDCTVPGKLACNTGTEKCVECVKDANCSGATPYCEKLTSYSCVQCLTDTNCVDLMMGYTTCSPTLHTCS